MLYWITQQLAGRIPGAHVFAYLTFRAILATASALGLSLLVGPSVIRHLVRGQIGQVVRDDSPPTHLLKAGTPTMGGTLILVATLVSTLLWAELTNRLVWTVLGVTFAVGGVRPSTVDRRGVGRGTQRWGRSRMPQPSDVSTRLWARHDKGLVWPVPGAASAFGPVPPRPVHPRRLVRPAQSRVLAGVATRISVPPMVGVPALRRW